MSSDGTIRHRRGYTALPNHVISDRRLSIEARGLLVLLASFREGWAFRFGHIAEQCNAGREKLQRMLRELRENDYLSTDVCRNAAGQIVGRDWLVDVDPASHPANMPSDGKHVGRETDPYKNTNSKPPSEEQEEEPTAAPQPSLFSADPERAKRDPVAREETAREGFEEFWSAYPASHRKTDKPKARELFASITAGKRKGIAKTDPGVIVAAARAYAASKPDPEFIPLPTTWLNGARWEQWSGVEAPKPPADEARAAMVEALRYWWIEKDRRTRGGWSTETQMEIVLRTDCEEIARRHGYTREQVAAMLVEAKGAVAQGQAA